MSKSQAQTIESQLIGGFIMENTLNIDVVEAVGLREHITSQQIEFGKKMATIYCAKPIKGNEDNFFDFLATVFNAGRIDGIRSERSKRGEV